MISRSTTTSTERNILLSLFRDKCIVCRQPGGEVHEIVPKSLAPETWNTVGNKVLLCRQHHEWAHSRGTKHSAPILRRYREKRIYEYYGKQAT